MRRAPLCAAPCWRWSVGPQGGVTVQRPLIGAHINHLSDILWDERAGARPRLCSPLGRPSVSNITVRASTISALRRRAGFFKRMCNIWTFLLHAFAIWWFFHFGS